MSETGNASQRPREGVVRITREDWLNVSLDALISSGVDQVKILTLAAKLGVSRSSFYWFFESREQLLDVLLDNWKRKNTRGIVEHCAIESASITEAILNVADCWLDDALFDPRLDFAIRAWARTDDRVRKIVDQADETRVEALRQLFMRHGYEPVEGFIRARVFYFTQIGYYALDLQEPIASRTAYLAAYVKTATGVEPKADLIESYLKRFYDGKRVTTGVTKADAVD